MLFEISPPRMYSLYVQWTPPPSLTAWLPVILTFSRVSWPKLQMPPPSSSAQPPVILPPPLLSLIVRLPRFMMTAPPAVGFVRARSIVWPFRSMVSALVFQTL